MAAKTKPTARLLVATVALLAVQGHSSRPPSPSASPFLACSCNVASQVQPCMEADHPTQLLVTGRNISDKTGVCRFSTVKDPRGKVPACTAVVMGDGRRILSCSLSGDYLDETKCSSLRRMTQCSCSHYSLCNADVTVAPNGDVRVNSPPHSTSTSATRTRARHLHARTSDASPTTREKQTTGISKSYLRATTTTKMYTTKKTTTAVSPIRTTFTTSTRTPKTTITTNTVTTTPVPVLFQEPEGHIRIATLGPDPRLQPELFPVDAEKLTKSATEINEPKSLTSTISSQGSTSTFNLITVTMSDSAALSTMPKSTTSSSGTAQQNSLLLIESILICLFISHVLLLLIAT